VFAKAILDLCPRHYTDDSSRTIWRQLIRAAPSASGNLDEADEASSDDDFVYKMKVVLREMKESRRWLRFIARCKLQHHDRLGNLVDEGRQLASIFATIVRNVERRLEAERAPRERRSKH
jgi:four helix bundle protein